MINQFKTFRIGTDLTVNFHFLSKVTTLPVDISNFERELSFTTGRGRSSIPTTALSGDGSTISWFFDAAEQALTGDYYVSVKLRTPDGTPALTQDFKAFRLSNYGDGETAVIELYCYVDFGESMAIIPEISDETGNWVINGVDTGKPATCVLYDTTGTHTDGTMTQKALTELFAEKLDIESFNEYAEPLTEEETITLFNLQ